MGLAYGIPSMRFQTFARSGISPNEIRDGWTLDPEGGLCEWDEKRGCVLLGDPVSRQLGRLRDPRVRSNNLRSYGELHPTEKSGETPSEPVERVRGIVQEKRKHGW